MRQATSLIIALFCLISIGNITMGATVCHCGTFGSGTYEYTVTGENCCKDQALSDGIHRVYEMTDNGVWVQTGERKVPGSDAQLKCCKRFGSGSN